jgi:hypothetical protein
MHPFHNISFQDIKAKATGASLANFKVKMELNCPDCLKLLKFASYFQIQILNGNFI